MILSLLAALNIVMNELCCHVNDDSQLVVLPVGKQLRLGPWGWGQVDWQVPTARVCDCNTYDHVLQVDHMVVQVVSASCRLVYWPNRMLWTDNSGGGQEPIKKAEMRGVLGGGHFLKQSMLAIRKNWSRAEIQKDLETVFHRWVTYYLREHVCSGLLQKPD